MRCARSGRRYGLWIVLCLLAQFASAQPLTTTQPGSIQAATTHRLALTQAEAALADWQSAVPPTTGWLSVRLMDVWTTRWPTHDGVVWYRLHWQQASAEQPVGLLVKYVSMADVIYVNGSEIARDPQLIDPLTRQWVRPQYFLLSPPTLRKGGNTLLIRVSGLAAYQPGLGKVVVGAPALLQQQYQQAMFQRFYLKLTAIIMMAVLGGIFLMLWLFRREESAFGWFALSELAFSLYSYNYIAVSPWPFSNTDAWSAFNLVFYTLAGAGFTLFLLRYSDARFPWLERAMGVICLLVLCLAVTVPAWLGPHRDPWYLFGGVFYYAGIGWFWWRAWRASRIDYRVLAVCLLLAVLASLHDFALFYGLFNSDTYLLGATSILTLVGIAFVLAYRFVEAIRRVEGFNVELKYEVDDATRQLSATLNREHALSLANSHNHERLQLTRDLHDGFGGTLVSAIAELENTPVDTPKSELVALLKDMRDDLRLVLNSTTAEHTTLIDLLAPLRYRFDRQLDAAGINSHWHFDGLGSIELGSTRSLDLLRLLQEALTNVLKHSQAARVDVTIRRCDNALSVTVCDNGQGIDQTETCASQVLGRGKGCASMRQRAARLGGELQFNSSLGGCQLTVVFALSD